MDGPELRASVESSQRLKTRRGPFYAQFLQLLSSSTAIVLGGFSCTEVGGINQQGRTGNGMLKPR